jgi:hypothetical protein
MQLARRGSQWSLGHVNRGKWTAHGDWFHGVRAAHRSGTHQLIIAPKPEVSDPSHRHSRCLSSGRSHVCCGVVSNGCCCEVSAPRGAVFKAAPPPPKLAIACTPLDYKRGDKLRRARSRCAAEKADHRHWVDTRSHVGSRRLASAHRYSVPGAFHTAHSWLKASHTVMPRRLAAGKFRHVRSHSEAAIMARNGVHRSILPEH